MVFSSHQPPEDGGGGGKEGRKDYICSSRLGLIRWYDRYRSDRRIQQVKAILDKVRRCRCAWESSPARWALPKQARLKKWIRASCSLCFARRNSTSPPQYVHCFAKMLPATTLKPTFTGPRVPVAQRTRVAVSRATVRVRAGPYDEELIATAVRGPHADLTHPGFAAQLLADMIGQE